MAVSVDAALDIISNIKHQQKFEIIPIEDAQNRICAKEIIATSSLPKFDNSAMDGYAIIYNDKNNELKVIDTIFAGDDNHTILEENTCVKIMTGARVPKNTTAIIPKEDIKITNDKNIHILENVKEFQHIRFIGEDIKTNEKLINIGDELNFAKITLLASQGISHIEVFKKPKIVVFSSGEELKLHYEKIEDHQIYNSNTPTLISRMKELNCDVTFIGQAKDTIEDIKRLVLNSLDADLIVTSGGVSVGDADFTRAAFNELNFETLIDGIMIKPGKPTIFGKINSTFILNLPGNPLASTLIFELFGKILIQKLLGSNKIYPSYIESKISQDFKTRKGRVTIIPGIFDGESFTVSQKRSPGMVSILASCNSLVVLNDTVEYLAKDSKIKILPINWKFFSKEKKDFLSND